MSDQDYALTVLKYKKKTNNPEGRETLEEYYERMSGIIYLYSAMMVTPVTDGTQDLVCCCIERLTKLL